VHIRYATDPTQVNSNYRAYQPMEAIARKGHEVSYNGQGPAFTAELATADVVHVHRFLGGDAQSAVEALRARGVGLVWDNDDDIANLPKSNPLYSKFGGASRAGLVRVLQAMLRTVDVVTTPSSVLADRFRAAGAHDVRVIENYLPDSFPGAKAPKRPGVNVVWLAALEHQVDYQQLRLRDTLLRLLDAHGDLRIISIGLGLGLSSDRYEHLPHVDFLSLPRELARADVGIAPLADMPWNQAKSNVKLKEYGAAGLPWLASPVGPYLGLGEREGGALVPEDAWYEALDRLIADARTRKKLAKRAAKWAKGQTISKHVGEWEAVYRDAQASAVERRKGG